MKITSTFSASFFFSFYSAGLGLLSVNESINIQIFTLQVYTFVCQFCTCSQIKIYKFLSFATLLLQFKKKKLVCPWLCVHIHVHVSADMSRYTKLSFCLSAFAVW